MKGMPLLVVGLFLAIGPDTIPPLPPSKFCQDSGLTAADGTQIKQPNCVSLEIGEIPSVDNMVSALIVNPKNTQTIRKDTPFTVEVKIANLATGFFTDPEVDYYQVQQTLDDRGTIQGHSHVVIQRLNGTNVPDPRAVAFFKGLNDAAVNGVLSATVENGLPEAGRYRVCTMNTSNSHQPVVMPTAQHGAQDDCIRITVE